MFAILLLRLMVGGLRHSGWSHLKTGRAEQEHRNEQKIHESSGAAEVAGPLGVFRRVTQLAATGLNLLMLEAQSKRRSLCGRQAFGASTVLLLAL